MLPMLTLTSIYRFPKVNRFLWTLVLFVIFSSAGSSAVSVPLSSGAWNPISANNSVSATATMVCADGKGPLLEGEERIFPCAGECPGGFECEFPEGRDKGGICCPNLEELYRLYKEESGEAKEGDDRRRGGGDRGGEEPQKDEEEEEEEEKEEKREERRKEKPKEDEKMKQQQKPKKNKKEGTTRKAAKGETGGVDAMALLEQHYGDGIARPVRVRPTDASSLAPSVDPITNLVHSHSVEVRRTQSKAQSNFHQQQPSANDFVWRPRWAQHSSKTVVVPNKNRNMDASGEEYSCRRQRLELLCEDRRRQTQFVLRWYAKEGVCVSYPWGYCSGKPVASDPTLRTREECEMLCTDPLDSGAIEASVAHLGEEKGSSGEKNIGAVGENGAIPSVDLSKPEEVPFESSTNGQPIGDVLLPPENFSEPEEIGGTGGDVQAQQGMFAVAGAQNVEVAPVEESNPTASSAEFSEFLFSEQQRQPKKRCLKVTPYRSMCPDGMPSQFTLRWHIRGDACFAYPYGYCHGETVMSEEPIKTERECVETCGEGGSEAQRMPMEVKKQRNRTMRRNSIRRRHH